MWLTNCNDKQKQCFNVRLNSGVREVIPVIFPCLVFGLTCQVWGLCVRCHSCEGTLTPGQSPQNTCEPCPREEDRCFSTGWHNPHLPRTPWPCTDASVSQKSRTLKPQTGFQQRSGCLAPQTPAGSGFWASGSDGLSSSWQNVDGFPCGERGTQRCTKGQMWATEELIKRFKKGKQERTKKEPGWFNTNS